MIPDHPICDYLEEWTVRATCAACGHAVALDMASIVERLGRDCSIGAMRQRLSCAQCGARGRAIIGTVPKRWG